jgi:hypothetical protein
MHTTKTIFCSADNRFAVIEMESRDDHGRIDYQGTVELRGRHYYFSDTNDQVCEGFCRLGNALYSGFTPSQNAGKVYKTARGYDKALTAWSSVDDLVNRNLAYFLSAIRHSGVDYDMDEESVREFLKSRWKLFDEECTSKGISADQVLRGVIAEVLANPEFKPLLRSYEDNGDEGQLEFIDNDKLYVGWKLRDDVVHYWLQDEGETDSTADEPEGDWESEVRDILCYLALGGSFVRD